MIYTDDMPKLVKVYKIDIGKEKAAHVIHQSDPLLSIVDYGNGNKH